MTALFRHVRLISFDLDDTLWPCHATIRAAESAHYAWLQREAPRLTMAYSFEALRAHRVAWAERYPEIAHDLTAVRLQALSALCEQTGYPVALAQRASDVFRQARNQVMPFDDVFGALERLRGGYTLVSVTNGNAQIEFTPLHASFDHSLTAAEVGAAKPDPAIFHVASQRTGIPLDAFLHVGDDPQRDIGAAQRIGLSTVWVNREGRDWPEGLERADLEVEDIAELAATMMG